MLPRPMNGFGGCLLTGVTQLGTERCPVLAKTLIFAFYETILSAGHLDRVSPVIERRSRAYDHDKRKIASGHRRW